MSHVPAIGAFRLAPVLNDACQCFWLDRAQLHRQLIQNLGDAAQLMESRPGLISGTVVFLGPDEAASMDRTVSLVTRALASPAFRSHVDKQAPEIARRPQDVTPGMLGFDFHLGGTQPQLIEVNTNPGGLLVNLELARAVTAGCDCLAEPLASLVSGNLPLADVPAGVIDSFRAEWQTARGETSPIRVAIVDDDPANQYLYPEFLLYQRLFERSGWTAEVVDAQTLEYRRGVLEADGHAIDLVYNRLTDFYLTEPRHAALRQAFESSSTVITPNPAHHARCADKRLLVALRDESLLATAGLDANERAHLMQAIPLTEIVDPAAADDLWRRRKDLFFKPVDGYGSKAAYRGDKLTRATFERILSNRYVAQAVAPTSTRRVVIDGEESALRVDIRNYCSEGNTWLRAARLYRGQTTNFRTPGGGFAPVLTLPSANGPRGAVP
jgi:hypothetical protein